MRLDEGVVHLVRITSVIAEHLQHDVDRLAQFLLVALEPAQSLVAVYDVRFLLAMWGDCRDCFCHVSFLAFR